MYKKNRTIFGRKPNFWRRLLSFFVATCGLFFIALIGFMLYLDVQVLARFSPENKWQVPGKVYARALEIYEGASLKSDMLQTELELLRYERMVNPEGPGTYSIAKISGQKQRLSFVTRGFQFWDGVESEQRAIVHFNSGRVSRLTDERGVSIPIVRLEPVLIGGFFPGHREDRLLIRLNEAPEELIQTLLLVEDRQFFQHSGVSFRGIVRAFVTNIREGRLSQGGSTLTQQLVKNYFLHSERTFSRKVKEVLMAILLEFHFSKEQLLEAYLNEVYLGQAGSRAIHGFGLGSYHYFGRPLQSLSSEQIALLVGLVKGPSHYDPRRHPQRARARRDHVLNLMLDEGLIPEVERVALLSASLGVLSKTRNAVNQYPAFTDLVRRQLERDYPEKVLNSEGLMIHTTLDPLVQAALEDQVTKNLPVLVEQGQQQAKDLEVAALLSSPQSGEVLAMVGGSSVKVAGFNRALDAKRHVGSVIKPFVYLAALRQQKYALNSLISDEPFTLKQANGEVWTPRNFDKVSHGDVLLQEALVNSYNQATARLATDVGIEQTAHLLDIMGLNRRVRPLPALALGAIELSPIEVLQLYQTLAAGGFNTPLRAIRAVVRPDGSLVQRYPYDVRQVVPSAATFEIKHAMREVVDRGTARSLHARWHSAPVLAGKTGTTDDLRDSWFVGMADNYLGVVWVGRDQNGSTGLTGAQGALRIWADTMAQLPVQSLRLPLPEGYAYAWVHPATGAVLGPHCPQAFRVAMVADRVPDRPAGCDGLPLGPIERLIPAEPSRLRRFWPF